MADHVKIMNIIASHEQSVSTGTDHYHTIDVSTINSKINQARNELGFDSTYKLSYLALQVVTHISSSSPSVKLHCYIGNNSGTGNGNSNLGTKTTDIPNSSTTYTWDLNGYISGSSMSTSSGKYLIPFWDNAYVFKITIYCKVDVVIGFDNPYTVTLDANGGSVYPTSIKVIKGGTYGELPTPTREEKYKFNGWFTQATGGTQVSNATIVNSSHTLYAQWELKTFKITFRDFDGHEIQSFYCNYGDMPVYTGYNHYTTIVDWQYVNVYMGWDKEITPAYEDKVYTAVYELKPRKYELVYYDHSGYEAADVSGFGVYYYNDIATLTVNQYDRHKDITYTIYTKNDNSLDSFQGKLDPSATFKLDETLLPKIARKDEGIVIDYENEYSPITFNITTYYNIYTIYYNSEPSNGGAVQHLYYNSEGKEEWHNVISELGYRPYPDSTVRADAYPGYKFVKWSDGVTDNPRVVKKDDNYTYTAIFELGNYTIEVKASPPEGGVVTGSGVYQGYDTARTTGTANEGYKLVGVYENSKWRGPYDYYNFGVVEDSEIIYVFEKLKMKFKSVKILHYSTSEVASPTNPLTGGEDQAIIEIKIAFE